jgi:hypothetical protein
MLESRWITKKFPSACIPTFLSLTAKRAGVNHPGVPGRSSRASAQLAA